MMYMNIPAPFIMVIGGKNKHQSLLENWRTYEHHHNFRAIKKYFSKHKPALVIAYITDLEDEKFSRKTTQYIRDGLSNLDTRIILIREPDVTLDEIDWMETLQVNGCLVAENNKKSLNLSILNREIETFLHIDNYRIQHNAETDMLMCITQFSRDNEPLLDLLVKFSASLSNLCYSACSFHIKIKSNQKGTLCYCDHSDEQLKNALHTLLALPSIPDYLQSVLNENHPQIDLLPEVMQLSAIEEKLGTTIGSYLSFPISAYGKVIYLLCFLIPESQMDKVSMRQINIMNKAFEQLTMLLERRQAENSLKKQYQRLKLALCELKTTKAELQTKEKMASIGTMAAGIAHEINNPLSYVISNFSSLDSYLKNIMQLQDLQKEFLSSIETSQHKESQALRQHISEFEEEQDIPFILEDIRAVVSDSYNGLHRVKNIINDLKSFTYSQSTQLEICDLKTVIDDTLKLLTYDIADTISIQTALAELPEFMAHNGLMQQVLTNLVKNAAQALYSANTPQPIIKITAQHREKTVFLSVRDNGPGIPDEVREKIFEPFFTTKTVGEGTGLGLSVTFNIIKQLGGEITLESEVDKFTQFLIRFPVS